MPQVYQSRLSSVALSVLLGLGTGAIAACTAPEESADTTPDVEIVTLYVGPEKVDCVGVAPQQCLQVRYSPDDEYELLVEKTPVENPPADASSIEWTLVDVVSQNLAEPNP